MIRVLAAVATIVLLVAATPQTTLRAVEADVMCAECGTPLAVSQSAVADRERAFIRRLVNQGKTKAQIEQALVDQFGPAVLASPDDRGFNITAWLVPALLVIGGAAAVAFTARRWRRSSAGTATPPAAPDLDPEDARRLDAELAAFDR